MPCPRGGLSLGILSLLPCLKQIWLKLSTSASPPSPQWWSRDITTICSQGEEGGVHSVWLRDLANIVVSRGILGGVPCMLNQNRHYLTHSSSVSASDGSPATMRRLLLWTSGGGAAMRNESWAWPEVWDDGSSSSSLWFYAQSTSAVISGR